MNDTIVAIATAHGVASISILRISGEEALAIAHKVSKLQEIIPRHAHLTSIYTYDNTLIDRAIMIHFKAPFSFTGEEIVEFQCHGGMIVAQEVLDTILAHGARLAGAGEFSKRAFLNGKMDLTEAEAVSKLIEAKSVDAVKILAKQMKGELKVFVNESREALLRSLAYSEVMIDYAEEDIPDDIMQSIVTQLDSLTEKITQIVEASHRRRGLIEGFKVAIIGKPNVGKSSLLNALLSYDRAIVSDIAGTTRDTIEEQVRIGSHIIRLVDTAGIRNSEDIIEKIGIERSLSSVEEADIIIALFDSATISNEEDEKIFTLLESLEDKEIIIGLNKSDLPRLFEHKKLSHFDILEVSATRSFFKLTTKLENIFDKIGEGDELMLISARQIEAVTSAKEAILEAKIPLLDGELEFFSYHLQEAVKAISSISKPYDNEEILDKMFGEFCLGK
ncbi:GTPase and tRNA-U34 5-formylation enzyme TrmE [hydrothermal vent metagenome]|uniref:GTPase and tRNA-U34 5-formylation enzyme TrmE n=1 Tax=hydrothermal vent metagenome TaxID=652676 RepID=A0A1W1BML1_9ZZZZ